MTNTERRAGIETRLAQLATIREQLKAAAASGQTTTYTVLLSQVRRIQSDLECNFGFNQW